MLAKKLGFGSFVFVCNNPTHNLSSIKLFIIFVAFFGFSKTFGIASVLSLGVMTPLFTPVILTKGAWYFWAWSPLYSYYPSYLVESFCKGAWYCFCLAFGCTTKLFWPRGFCISVVSFRCDIPTYYSSYLMDSFWAYVLVLKFILFILFIVLLFFILFILFIFYFVFVNFLFGKTSIDYNRNSAPLCFT